MGMLLGGNEIRFSRAHQSNRHVNQRSRGSGKPRLTNEAGAGIEPANRGFADPDLTTWLPRHRFANRRVKASNRAVNEGPGPNWSNGVMEWWGLNQYSNTPILQYSNTPILQYSNTPILQYSNELVLV